MCDPQQAAHAAEWALAAMALRAAFSRAIEHEPNVVELRVSVVRDGPSGAAAELTFEFVDPAGNAIGGGAL